MIQITDYITLGRSGLKVSPICLGTMTFGNYRWGSQDDEARQIFVRYVESGGNFIDTADGYAAGKSEELTGSYIRELGLRDRVVLATKFTFNTSEGNPNAGGNGRKNIYRALEGSLRRLGTDYIDLYWMHAWDMMTPFDEVVNTLSDLVREGKVRYYGLSDVPAWYAARAATFAEYNSRERPIALQLEARPPRKSPLNWVVTQPGITSTIIGARRPQQLPDNLGALAFDLPGEFRRELDEVSKLDGVHPYMFFEPFTQERINGGVAVRRWSGTSISED